MRPPVADYVIEEHHTDDDEHSGVFIGALCVLAGAVSFGMCLGFLIAVQIF